MFTFSPKERTSKALPTGSAFFIVIETTGSAGGGPRVAFVINIEQSEPLLKRFHFRKNMARLRAAGQGMKKRSFQYVTLEVCWYPALLGLTHATSTCSKGGAFEYAFPCLAYAGIRLYALPRRPRGDSSRPGIPFSSCAAGPFCLVSDL